MRGLQSGEEGRHKCSDRWCRTSLSSNARPFWLVCGSRVLLENVGASVSDSVHSWIKNIPHKFLVDHGGEPQALWEEELGMTYHLLEINERTMTEEGKLVCYTEETSSMSFQRYLSFCLLLFRPRSKFFSSEEILSIWHNFS